MNPLAKLAIYLGAVVFTACVLAPPVYWFLHDAHPFLEGMPFHRFFNRVALVAAVLLLWPTLRWVNVRSRAELGLERNARPWRDLQLGMLLATAPLLALAAYYFGFEIYRVRSEINWAKFGAIIATSAVVPFLEEAFFRGLLLGLAVRSLGAMAGGILVSAIFAVVHFVRQRGEVADVHWWSGFALLGTVFPRPEDLVVTAFGALNLFVIGLVLALATLRTRSLWMPIGLHAAWIFGQQALNVIARYRVKPPDALLPWVGPTVVSGMVPTGLVPLAALLVTGGLVWWTLRRGRGAYA